MHTLLVITSLLSFFGSLVIWWAIKDMYMGIEKCRSAFEETKRSMFALHQDLERNTKAIHDMASQGIHIVDAAKTLQNEVRVLDRTVIEVAGMIKGEN